MIDLRPNLLAIVQGILQRLVPACEVRAFGSRQKWTAKETSDLDLAVVGTQRLPLKTMAALKEAFEESILPMRVDVLDWNAISEEFRRVIEAGFEVIQGAEVFSHAPAPAHRPLSAAEGGVSKGGGQGSSATPLRGGAPRSPLSLSKGNAPGWPYIELSRIAKLRSGFPFKSSDWIDSGVPVIKISNVKNGRILPDGCGYVSGEVAEKVPEWMTTEDDLLIAMTGYVGELAFVRRGERFLINQRVGRFDFFSDSLVIPKFLFYYLQQAEIRAQIEMMARGSAQPNLSAGDVSKLRVPTPPLPIQKAIAHILGTLDDRIELCRRMNETLEAMARSLFKDWFIDFGPVRAKMEGREPPGLSPEIAALFSSKLVDSELGEIPEGWEISTIGEEVRAVGGGTPSTKEPEFWDNGCHFWATPKDLSKLQFPVVLETERKITDGGLAKISSGLLPVGTLLLSSRAPIGYMAITEVPLAVNQGFIAMICDKRISNIFAYFWCKENMDRIIGNANGSTFQEISKSNFRPLPMLIPPKGILAAFSAATHDIYQQLVTNQIQANLLSKTRDNLLPKLLSGALSLEGVELA